MHHYTQFQTPFCEMILVGNEFGISHLHLCTGEGKRTFDIHPEWARHDAFFKETTAQVQRFIAGEQKELHVVVNPSGTYFQKRVWAELARIPFGKLRSYKDIAEAIGNKKASRAVGMAISKNPIPLIIPCHRVVGANGKLTGFAHGLSIKEKLIELERKQRRIDHVCSDI
jgi:methylated-DNA-[protein]-cysteine S-methyltransferase